MRGLVKPLPLLSRALAAAACFSGLARIEGAIFTNEGGDSLFSNPANWSGGNLPAANERVDVAGATNIDQPALVDRQWAGDPGNIFISGAACLTVPEGGVLKFGNLSIGGNGRQQSGQLTVLDGGAINAHFANSGMLVVGGGFSDDAKGGEGVLVLHGEAISNNLASLRVTPKGTLEFVANQDSLARVFLKGDNVWAMDGRLKFDLSKLGKTGVFSVISHEADGKPGALMSGALADWLKTGNGKQSGQGDGEFGGGLLEVVGSKGRVWELACDGDSSPVTLTFTVK
ncbi:MAG: hypothetical protein D4R65_13630 [Verrucomicrobiaceae bacterium]|nr:MAG: hypothetical protein D4R65_13630 [Verrucomicrobiaceae bacterium]